MKSILKILAAGLLIIGLAACSDSSQSGHPQGMVEDLWGNEINLSDYNDGPVLLQPFSPSNCGECLIDGYFVSENYYHNTQKYGGAFFHLCLFNPQLDIYSFLKHYRDDAPVITGPTAVHSYHRNGFPYVIAFSKGEEVYNGGLYPYEEVFDSLRQLIWETDSVPLYPTSSLRMADKFISENRSLLGINVFPDGDTALIEEFNKGSEKVRQRYKDLDRDYFESCRAVYESQLTEDDYSKNLFFYGESHKFGFSILEGMDTPVKIGRENIAIGRYTFPKEDVGIIACFPNPWNSQRYISLRLRGKNLKTGINASHVDFLVYHNGPGDSAEILLQGLFAKDGHRWEFSPLHSRGAESVGKFCQGGKCPAPVASTAKSIDSERKGAEITISSSDSPIGNLWTLGGKACRFPSLMVDRQGIAWVVWEEQGDIILSSANKSGEQTVIEVENDGSDSFNPIIAGDGNDLWVFYLNDSDGFYHLYGTSYDGAKMSQEIMLCENEPLDVITPAVAYDGEGRMALAWSEWKSNCRHLKYRVIENRVPGKIESVQIKMPDNKYINAWHPSLAMDSEGAIRGCWNQHYPATLGVYAGDLAHEAGAVIPNNDDGGYPSIAFDNDDIPWVVWESFMWDYHLEGKTHSIQAAYYDENEGGWSLPYAISSDSLSVLNQTPKIAVDDDGILWVVWSGRKSEDNPWDIFMAFFENGVWSSPMIISTPGENARAPVIDIDRRGGVWIAWHAGTGDNMKIKVLNFQTSEEYSAKDI